MGIIFKKHKKMLIILSVLIGLFMAVVLAAVFFVFQKTTYSRKQLEVSMSGKVDWMGTAHFVNSAGQETIVRQVKQAERTADQKFIISLDIGAGLSVVNISNEEEIQAIDTGIDEICTVRNTGFVYSKIIDEVYYYYRYTFTDNNIVELGDCVYIPADDSLDLLISRAGQICVLYEEDRLLNVVGLDEDGEPELIDISNNGDIAVWAVIEKNIHSLYVFRQGESLLIDQVELEEELLEYSYYNVYFNHKMNEFILMNNVFHKIYTMRIGEEVTIIDFGELWYGSAVYTRNDSFGYDEKATIDAFYIVAGNEQELSIYYIRQGELQEVVEDILYLYDIKNGSICYSLQDDHLYMGYLKNDTVLSGERIASSVYYAELSEDGRYLYYIRDLDYETYTGALYCCTSDGDAVKIADEAEAYTTRVSSDGRTILYFTNLSGNTEGMYGDLATYTIGGSDKIIDTDVYRIQSVDYSLIDPKSFGYFKYSADAADGAVCDYYYYNGRTSQKIAEQVKIE